MATYPWCTLPISEILILICYVTSLVQEQKTEYFVQVNVVTEVALKLKTTGWHCGVTNSPLQITRALWWPAGWGVGMGRCVLHFVYAWSLSFLDFFTYFFYVGIVQLVICCNWERDILSLLYERSWPVLLSSVLLLGIMYRSGNYICAWATVI